MKKLLISLLLSGWFSFSAYADIIGPLRGTLGPGTINVIGSIFVYPGDSLTILPGTTLIFRGNYDFDIGGYIYAVGTEQDSISFLRDQSTIRWNGIDFLDSGDDNSIFEYCLIEGSDCVGLNITSADITIRRTTFKNSNAGGG